MPTNPKPLSRSGHRPDWRFNSTIGLCTAQLAALCGARLVLLSRSPRVLDALTGVIQSWGGEAMFLATDVTVREQVWPPRGPPWPASGASIPGSTTPPFPFTGALTR